jgi:DNA-directed RNA polymerase specialized sigma24 family protein
MIRPLTKRKKADQALYQRPAKVEAEIALAVTQDLATLQRRLLVTKPELPVYLQTETLVHLIRNSFRAGDVGLRDSVFNVLLGRCEVILESKVSNRLPNPVETREQILSDFTDLLVSDASDPTSEELDFYECRFMLAFRALRVGRVRTQLNEINRTTELPEDTDPVETDSNAISGRTSFRPLPAAFHEPVTPDDAAYREQLQEAIDRLSPDEREAFILVHMLGYDEEADDPAKETAATRCNCTGRTIRNRLRRAEKKLSTILSQEDL